MLPYASTLNFYGYTIKLEIHSFPTRRSSDLFSGGTVNVNGGYNVIGNTVINGGTANFNGSASMANGTLSGGNLSGVGTFRSEEHTSELQSHSDRVGSRTLAQKASLLIRSGGI